MLSKLLFEAPHIWKIIRDLLIGNGGKPSPEGFAISGYVRDAEIKYNAKPGSYWYRFFRPDDNMINGGTQYTYNSTFTTAIEEQILATGNVVTVQTREAIMSCGWICDIDLDQGGYLLVKKEGVTKSELNAKIVYRQQNPKGWYVDLDTVIHGYENAQIDYIAYNAFGANRSGIVIPILFRIAPRSALNLELPMER